MDFRLFFLFFSLENTKFKLIFKKQKKMDSTEAELSSDNEINLYFQKTYSTEILDLLSQKSSELFYDFSLE